MKNNKKIAAILILASFLFQTASPAIAGGVKALSDLTAARTATECTVGVTNANTIYFGNYWQTAENTAGDKEAIPWKVISTGAQVNYSNGSTTETVSALELMTNQLMYADKFGTDSNWSKSIVRAHLTGGTTANTAAATSVKAYGDLGSSFAKDALSEREYNALLPAQHTVAFKQATSANTVTVVDKLRLPSPTNLYVTTLTNANCIFIDQADRGTTSTTFSKKQNMYGNTGNLTVGGTGVTRTTSMFYWSDGNQYCSSTSYAFATYYQKVLSDKAVGIRNNLSTTNATGGVRPLVDFKASDVLFLSAPTNGKSTVGGGEGFTLPDYSGTEFVMTLKDSTMLTPTIDAWIESGGSTEIPTVDKLADEAPVGGTVDLSHGLSAGGGGGMYINYSGAATGTNKYLSALVTEDVDGSPYLNYAKIMSTETSGSANGVLINVTGLDEGSAYRMYFYSEEANGDYQTDFASDFATVNGGTNYYSFVAGGGGGGDTCYSGSLSLGYKDKPLTMAVGGTFNLSFDSGTYQTGIVAKANSTPAKNYGIINAGSTGTTLQSITVADNAELDTYGNFTLANDLAVNSGGRLIVGTPTTPGTLTVGGNATLGAGGVLASIGDLDIGGSASVGAGAQIVASGDLNIGGAVSIDGTGDVTTSGKIFAISESSIGGLTMAPGAYFNASAPLTVNGDVSCTSGAYMYANDNLTITGNLDVANDADVRTMTTGKSFNVGGNLTIAGGTAENSAKAPLVVSDSLTVGGDLTVAAGTAHNSGAALIVPNGLTVGGDLIIPNGFNANSTGMVQVTGGGLTVNGSVALGVIANRTAALPLTVVGGVNVCGDLSIVRGLTPNISSSYAKNPLVMTSGSALTVGGTFTLRNETGNSMTYTTAGALTAGGFNITSVNPSRMYDLKVTGATTLTGDGTSSIGYGGYVNATQGFTSTGSGNLNIASGGKLNVTGDVTATGGGSITIDNNSSSYLYVSGNMNMANGDLIVNGGKMCQSGTGHTNTFRNLQIGSGSGVAMNGSITLSGDNSVIGASPCGTISGITLNNGGDVSTPTGSKLTIASGQKVCSSITVAGNLATLENNGSGVYGSITNFGTVQGTGQYYGEITNKNGASVTVAVGQLQNGSYGISGINNEAGGTVTLGNGDLKVRLSGAGNYVTGGNINVSDVRRLNNIALNNAGGVLQIGDTTEYTLNSTVTGGDVKVYRNVAADTSKINADVNFYSSASILRLIGGSWTGDAAASLPVGFGSNITGVSGVIGIGGTTAGTSGNGAGSYVSLDLDKMTSGLPTVALYGASTCHSAVELTNGVLNSTVSGVTSGYDKNSTVVMAADTSFGVSGNISYYKVVLPENMEFSSGNFSCLSGLNSDGAVYKLNGAIGSSTGSNVQKISVVSHTGGDLTGTLSLAPDVSGITFSNDSSWADFTYKQIQYISSTATGDDLTVVGDPVIGTFTVGTTGNITYNITQAYNDPGDASSDARIGYLDVLKFDNNFTFKQIVNADPERAGKISAYSVGEDMTLTDTAGLGALRRSEEAAAAGNPRTFAISGNGGTAYTMDGGGYKGISVADSGQGAYAGAGDTLSVQSMKIQNFDTFITVNDGGKARLGNVEFGARAAGTTNDVDVKSGGTLEITLGSTANAVIKNAGSMTVSGALENATLVTSGSATVRGGGQIHDGSVTNTGTLTVNTGGALGGSMTLTNSGTLTSAENVVLLSVGNSGNMTIDKNLVADTGITNSGKLTVKGAGIETPTLDNRSGGSLTLTNAESVLMANITNAGTISSKGKVMSENMENSGTLTAAEIDVNSGLTNTGTLGSKSNITAYEFSNGNGGNVTAEGSVSTHTFENSGKVTASDVYANYTLNNSGAVTSRGDVSAAAELTNSGTITAEHISGGYTVNNSGTITTDGIIANSAITNSGTLNSTGDVISENVGFTNSGTAAIGGYLNASSVTNSNSGKITVAADKIIAPNGVANSGTLVLNGADGEEFALLSADVTGNGTAEISGNVDAFSAGAGKLENKLKINADSTLQIAVAGIKGDVTDNSGTLWLAGDGTISHNLAGSGEVTLSGTVKNTKTIGAGKLNLTESASVNNEGTISTPVNNMGTLTSNADKLTGSEIVNSGAVIFSGGTLNGNYVSEGTHAKPALTQFSAATAFKGGVTMKASMLNFILDDFKAGDTIVTSANTIDLSDTKLRLYQDTEGKKVEELGTKLTLIDNATGYVSENEGKKYVGSDGKEYVVPKKIRVISTDDVFFDYIYDTFLDTTEDSGALILGVVRKASDEETGGTQTDPQDTPVTPQETPQTEQQDTPQTDPTPAPTPVVKEKTKSVVEARLGASAALNTAGDFIAGELTDNMDTAESTSGASGTAGGSSWNAFAAMGGSHGRYNTGSHVDLNSFNIAAGLSRKMNENLTLGVFVEGGNGHYDTVNEFAEGDVTAKGDLNYFGVGAMLKAKGRQTDKGQLHAEASVRTGRVSSDYASENFFSSTNVRYDTNSSYLGGHLGAGYKWTLKEGGKIDTYAQYLWSRQNGDSTVIQNNDFDFDAVSSHRLRAGFRYISTEHRNGIKLYGGLAYEYELDGKASGKVNGEKIPEPEFKGASGMAEFGAVYKPKNSPWKVDLGLKGFTGKHDGVAANLAAWYEFDGLIASGANGTDALTFSLRKNLKELMKEKDALTAENRTLKAENAAKKAEKARLKEENIDLKAKAAVKAATDKIEPAKIITTESVTTVKPAEQPKPEEQRKTDKIEKPVKPEIPEAAQPEEEKQAKPKKKGDIEGLGILDSPEILNY